MFFCITIRMEQDKNDKILQNTLNDIRDNLIKSSQIEKQKARLSVSGNNNSINKRKSIIDISN